jgi:hypothetical protein
MNRVENKSEAAICICDTAFGEFDLHAQLIVLVQKRL